MNAKIVRYTKRGIRALARFLYTENVAGMLVDLKGLRRSLRLLTLLGYLCVLGLLGLALLVDVLGDQQPVASLTIPYSDFWAQTPELAPLIGATVQFPLLVLLGSSLGLALGWAYILTGATDCRRRVFVPILLFFASQLLLIAYPLSNPDTLGIASLCISIIPCCGALLLPLLLLAAYVGAYRSPRWRELAWLEWPFWFGIVAAFTAAMWVMTNPEYVVLKLLGLYIWPVLFAIPWWLCSGLALVGLTLKVARASVTALRRLLPESALRSLSLLVTLSHPLAAGGVLLAVLLRAGKFETTAGIFTFALADCILTAPLALALLTLLALRRWNTRSAVTLLALNVVAPVFAYSLGVTITSITRAVAPTAAPGMLESWLPTLTFVALMAYSALNLGAGFANTDGKIIPRSGRVLLGFGVILLIISFTLFFANGDLRDAPGQSLIDLKGLSTNLPLLSALTLGFPYLLWTLWKRRDRLVGDEKALAGKTPLLAQLDTPRGRWLLIVVFLALILGLMLLCCGGLMIETFMLKPVT